MNSTRRFPAKAEEDSVERALLKRIARFMTEISDDRHEIWNHPAFVEFFEDVRTIIRKPH